MCEKKKKKKKKTLSDLIIEGGLKYKCLNIWTDKLININTWQ